MFVDTVLNASDEIFNVSPTKEWITSLRIKLRQHRAYLRSQHYADCGYLTQYTPKFRAFLRDILSEEPMRNA